MKHQPTRAGVQGVAVTSLKGVDGMIEGFRRGLSPGRWLWSAAVALAVWLGAAVTPAAAQDSDDDGWRDIDEINPLVLCPTNGGYGARHVTYPWYSRSPLVHRSLLATGGSGIAAAGAENSAAWTVECWVNPTVAAQSADLIVRRTPASINYCLRLTNGIPIVEFHGDTVFAPGTYLLYRAGGNAAIPLNEWTHLAGRWDPTTQALSLHVNGQMLQSQFCPAARAFQGGATTLARALRGYLDNAAIWTSARSTADISASMNLFGFTQNGVKAFPGGTNLVTLTAWFPFDDNGLTAEDYSVGGARNLAAAPSMLGALNVAASGASMTSADFMRSVGEWDTDADGMPDWWEYLMFASATGGVASSDPDADGLNNLAEYQIDTNPNQADSDNDGTFDTEEDFDGDGLENFDEQLLGSSPLLPDTDDDGLNDYQEIVLQSAAADATDPFVQRALSLGGGALDYVRFPSEPRFALRNWTLQAWVRPAAGWTGNGQVIRREIEPGVPNYYLSIDASLRPVAGFGTNFVRSAAAIAADGHTWTHLAAAYDSSIRDLRLFVNGVEVVRTTAKSQIRDSGYGPILHRVGQGFRGLIDDVRIFSSPFTAASINAARRTTLLGTEASLVAYYRFDDGTHPAGVSGRPDWRTGQVQEFLSTYAGDWSSDWVHGATLHGTASVTNLAASASPMNPDSDGDGMSDEWEINYGLDKNDPADAALDTDDDGLTNLQEFRGNTDPTQTDSDGDGFDDGTEDSDGDGLSNLDEINNHGTDLADPDSDDDGVSDGDELDVTKAKADGRRLTSPVYSRSPTIQRCLKMTNNVAGVQLPDNPPAEAGRFNVPEWTVEAWVYLDTAGQTGSIIERVTPNGRTNYALRVENNVPRLMCQTEGGQVIDVSAPDLAIAPRTWTHLAGSWSPGRNSLELVVNGSEPRARASLTSPYRGSGQGVTRIARGLTGYLDEVRVWRLALDAETVARNRDWFGASHYSATITNVSGVVDIVFLIDTTGSMGMPIDNVKDNVRSFVEELESRGFDAQIAGVRFSDTLEGGGFSDTLPDGEGFFSAVDDFVTEWLDPLELEGGGDWEEDDLGGLTYAMDGDNFTPSYRTGASKVFILVTDAPMKDTEDGDTGAVLSREDVINDLVARNITVHVVRTPGTEDVEEVADRTGGLQFDISAGSWDEIFDTIAGSISAITNTFDVSALVAWYPFDDSENHTVSNPLTGGVTGYGAEDYTLRMQWDFALPGVEFSTNEVLLLKGELDRDNDEMPDWWEDLMFGVMRPVTNTDGVVTLQRIGNTSPTNDVDGDGLRDLYEYILDTNPLARDTDGDGVLDGVEDPDGDGLGNADELGIYGSNPLDGDTDDDGVTDWDEVNAGTDPTDYLSPYVLRYLHCDGTATLEVPTGVPGELYDGQRFDLPEWTLEAWVRLEEIPSATNIVLIQRRVVPNGYLNYELGISTRGVPYIRFQTANGQELRVDGYSPVATNEWVLLGARYGAKDERNSGHRQLSLYVNGVRIVRDTTDVRPAVGAQVGKLVLARNLKGDLDEVRIWRQAVADSFIESMLGKTLSFGYDAIVMGSLNPGEGGYLKARYDRYNQSGNFTVWGWFKTEQDGSVVYRKGSTAPEDGAQLYNYMLNINGGVVEARLDALYSVMIPPAIFFCNAELWATHTLIGATPVNDGEWHHAALVYNGTEAILYVDGAEEARTQVAMPRLESVQWHEVVAPTNICGLVRLADDANDLIIGEGLGDALVDEVAIYNVSLSSLEVKAGRLGKTEVAGRVSGYFDFDFDDTSDEVVADQANVASQGELIGAAAVIVASGANAPIVADNRQILARGMAAYFAMDDGRSPWRTSRQVEDFVAPGRNKAYAITLSPSTNAVDFVPVVNTYGQYAPAMRYPVFFPQPVDSPLRVDTDSDAMPDVFEQYFGLDVNRSEPPERLEAGPLGDLDGDGFPNLYEYYAGSDPTFWDSDGNGVSDGDEDADGDQISNASEYIMGTHPGRTDTDDDGLTDWEEMDSMQLTGKASSPTDSMDPKDETAADPRLRYKALALDGQRHELPRPLMDRYRFNGASWTVECWYRPASSTATGRLIEYAGQSWSNNTARTLIYYQMGVNGGVPYITFSGSRLYVLRPTNVSPLIAGRWVHLAAVFDEEANTLALYRDGLAVAQTEVHDASLSGQETARRIPGRAFLGDSGLTGAMDDVRIWTGARSAEQIADGIVHLVQANTPDLVVNFRFDDGRQGDLSNGAADGVLANEGRGAEDFTHRPSATDLEWAWTYSLRGIVFDTGTLPPYTGVEFDDADQDAVRDGWENLHFGQVIRYYDTSRDATGLIQASDPIDGRAPAGEDPARMLQSLGWTIDFAPVESIHQRRWWDTPDAGWLIKSFIVSETIESAELRLIFDTNVGASSRVVYVNGELLDLGAGGVQASPDTFSPQGINTQYDTFYVPTEVLAPLLRQGHNRISVQMVNDDGTIPYEYFDAQLLLNGDTFLIRKSNDTAATSEEKRWWLFGSLGTMTPPPADWKGREWHDADYGSDTDADTDGDGLLNGFEQWTGTNPRGRDSDNDGIADSLEDSDGDGLQNAMESSSGSDPRLKDTDDDGLSDREESDAGTSPVRSLSPLRDRVLRSDGAQGSYVELPWAPRFALSGWAIEAWIEPAALPSGTGWILSRVVQSGVTNYCLGIDSAGRVTTTFTAGDHSGQVKLTTPAALVVTGRWSHVQSVFDSGTGKFTIRVNGIVAAELFTGKRPASSGVGPVSAVVGRGFNGYIDEVRIWSADPGIRGITQLQKVLAGNEANLVSYLRFDDGTHALGTSARAGWTWGQVEDFTQAKSWLRGWHDAATPFGAAAVVAAPADAVVSGEVSDTDGDGMPDGWESAHGLDSNSPLDAALDADGDGLSNLDEYRSGTDPRLVDSDADGVRDNIEDSDGDGLGNAEEVSLYHTNPGDPDTDDDTFSDGDEVDSTIPCAGRLVTSPLYSRSPLVQRSMVLNGLPTEIPSRISGTDTDRFDIATWTLDCWYRPADSNQTGYLIRRRTDSGQTTFALRLTNNVPMVEFTTEAGKRYFAGATAKLPANEWTEIAGVWSPSNDTLRLYLNGVSFQAQMSLGECAQGAGSTTVGEGLHGWLDELRVWNTDIDFQPPAGGTSTNDNGGGTNNTGGATGPYAVTPQGSGQALWNALMTKPLPAGVTGLSVTLVGAAAAAGTYSNFPYMPQGMTPPNGIVLSSGNAADAGITSNSTSGISTDLNQPGDTNLTALVAPEVTHDATALVITFTTDASVPGVSFYLLFATDEFPEYVGSFNDAFGAFLDGVNISFDSQNRPITVNNNFFLLDNDPWDPTDTNSLNKLQVNMPFEFDGLTPLLVTSHSLQPGTHTLKLVVSDTRDSVLDSVVFLSNFQFALAGGEGTSIATGGGGTGAEGAVGMVAQYRFDDGGRTAEDFVHQLDWDYALSGATVTTNAYAYMTDMGDADLDRLPNWWETIFFGTNVGASATADPDADGLTNLGEYFCDTNPRDRDSDNDGIRDGWEDYDGDGLNNALEIARNSDPRYPDTDDDGTDDGDEAADGTSAIESLSPLVDRVLELDGAAGSFVELPRSVRLALSTWVVEAWVKPEAVNSEAAIVRREVRPGVENYFLGIDAQRRPVVRFSVIGPRGITNVVARVPLQNALPLGAWSHVSGAFDESTGILSIYVNGQMLASQRTQWRPELTDVGPIHARVGEGFVGRIDEVRLWTAMPTVTNFVPLTSGQINANAGPNGGSMPASLFLPQGVYRFNYAGGEWQSSTNVPAVLRSDIAIGSAFSNIAAQVNAANPSATFAWGGGNALVFIPVANATNNTGGPMLYSIDRQVSGKRTAADLEHALATPPPSLLAYYRFDDGTNPNGTSGMGWGWGQAQDFASGVGQDWLNEWSSGGTLMGNAAFADAEPDSPVQSAKEDSDGDGLPDWWEMWRFGALDVAGSGSLFGYGDADFDNLNDYYEYLAGLDPLDADTDNDGIRDGEEDGDGDGLTNNQEQAYRTDPLKSDSDDDGRTDKQEVSTTPMSNPIFAMSQFPPTSPANVRGYAPRSLSLAGVPDGGLSVPDSRAFNRNGGSWTVELWTRLSNDGTGHLVSYEHAAGTYQYDISVSAGVPALSVNDVGTGPAHVLASQGSIQDGRWHYLAATWDSERGHLEFIVDAMIFQTNLFAGEVGFTNIPSQIAYGPGWLGIGRDMADGWVDEMRFWSVCRTRTDLADTRFTLAQSGLPELTGYFRFDDGGQHIEDFAHPNTPAYALQWAGGLTTTNQFATLMGVAHTTSDDADADGMPDWFEDLYGFAIRSADSPSNDVPDRVEDADGDKLNNRYEYLCGLNPRKKNTFNDGKSDGDRDSLDADGVKNYAEQCYASLPWLSDTDDDGKTDAAEIAGGSSPSDSSRPNEYGALNVSGSDYVQVPPVLEHALTNWTVSAWVRPQLGWTGSAPILIRSLSGGTGAIVTYELGLNRGGTRPGVPYIRFTAGGGAREYVVDATNLIDQAVPIAADGRAWTHLAGRYCVTNDTLSLFIDGRLNGAVKVAACDLPDLGGSALVERIGAGFRGRVAEVRIGTGDFSDEWVYLLYENATRITRASAVDIVFVFDTSGSMGGPIQQVIDNITLFTDELGLRGVDSRLAVLDYNDGPYGTNYMEETFTAYGFTEDPADVQDWVGTFVTDGGIELGTAATIYALNGDVFDPTYRENAKKIFVVITDENYDQGWAEQCILKGLQPMTVDEVTEELLRQEVRLYGVCDMQYGDVDGDGDGTPDLQEVAEATGGTRFDIYQGDWSAIFDQIAEAVEVGGGEVSLISDYAMTDGGQTVEDCASAQDWLNSPVPGYWPHAGVASSNAWHVTLVDAATPAGAQQPRYDTETDTVTNAQEIATGSRSDLADTDDDGVPDATEYAQGTHPNYSMSSGLTRPLPNRALDLGAAGPLRIPQPERLDWTNAAWSVEAWVRPVNASQSGPIVRNTIDGRTRCELGLTNNVPYVRFQNQAGKRFEMRAGYPLHAAEWAHIAGVLQPGEDGSLTLVYSYGLNVESWSLPIAAAVPTTGGTNDCADCVERSAILGAGSFTAGTLVDEVRMWNVARTPYAILATRDCLVQANTNSLMAYYRFDDAGRSIEDFAFMLHYLPGTPYTPRTWNGMDVVYEGYRFVVTGSTVPAAVVIPADPSPIRYGVNGTDSDDIDLDGLPDWFEDLNFGSVEDGQPELDNDNDSLNNLYEYLCLTAARKPDTDRDGILDANEDLDADGLKNGLEQEWLTRPDMPDTDDDGKSDKAEWTAPRLTIPTVSLSPVRTGALQLDGSGSVILPVEERLAVTNAWTVEAWVSPARNSRGGVIVTRRVGPGINYELGLTSQLVPYARMAGESEGLAYTNTCLSTLALATPERWYHLAATFDSNLRELSLYVNGVLRQKALVHGQYGALPRRGRIRAEVGTGFIGRIDEVRIWKVARTVDELASADLSVLNADVADLVCYYRFDDFTSPNFTSGVTGWRHGQVEDFSQPNGDWNWGWRNGGTLSGTAAMAATDTPIPASTINDVDNDGLPDWWEERFFGGSSAAVVEEDSDGDGLTEWYEYLAGTDPTRGDTFRDGFRDSERDSDGDGLKNGKEQELGTLPNAADTDDDGLTDREEITATDDAALSAAKPTRRSDPLLSIDPWKPGSLSLNGRSRMLVPPQSRHSMASWSVEAWVCPSNSADGIVLRRMVSDEVGEQGVNYELGVKPDGASLRPYVRYVGWTNGLPVEIRVNGSGPTEIVTNVLPRALLPRILITPNTWSHLAATYSATNHALRLYVNGYLAAYRIDAIELPLLGAGEDAEIGSEFTVGGGTLVNGVVQEGFEGYIDEVAVMQGVLSADDILAGAGGVGVMARVDAVAGPASERPIIQLDIQKAVSYAHTPNEMIVRMRDTVRPDDAEAAIRQLGGDPVAHYALADLRKVRIADGASLEAKLAQFRRDKRVLYAEPNYLLYLNEKTPNDTRFGELWGLKNVGQDGGVSNADIRATMAWDRGTGSSEILVAVIDTGVDYNHEDLSANMWKNPGEIPGNDIDDDNNGFVDDVYGYDFFDDDADPMDGIGHGSHVSGTIGGVGNNGKGVVGVNWNVKLMAVKIFPDVDGGAPLDVIVAGINYAVQMKARLSNNSYGGPGYSQAMYDAIAAARDAGHLFVAAAGNDGNDNDGQNPGYPASYDLENIIAVAATDRNDGMAYFSNYGATSVDLGAPGVGILSTTPGNNYEVYDGTSMASPHVCGAAALILSLKPSLTYGGVKDLILQGVDQVPALAGRTLTGGRLNLFRSLPAGNGGGDDEGGTLAGYFTFDDGGVTAEDFTTTEDWLAGWAHAGVLNGARVVTNAFSLDTVDTDLDGMPDWWEDLYFGEDVTVEGDPDGDGLDNLHEYLSGTDPRYSDTDLDGILDGDEDADGDGLSNLSEQNEYYTDPRERDSDDDGRYDGDELIAGTDPTDSRSPYIPRAVAFGGSGVEKDNTVVVSDRINQAWTARLSQPTWTIELFVMPTNSSFAGVTRRLVSRRDVRTGNRNFEIGLTNGWPYVCFDVEGTGEPRIVVSRTGRQATVNQWMHLAARLNENRMLTLFVDGRAVAALDTRAKCAVGAGDLILGSAGFAGLMKDVRIWRIAKSDDSIAQMWNRSLFFSGSSAGADYLVVGGGGQVKENSVSNVDVLPNLWTIEAWVRTEGAGVIAGKRTNADPNDESFNYAIEVLDNGTVRGRFTVRPALNAEEPVDHFINSTFAETTVADGQWHHVAYVRDADACYIYVDGLLVSKTPRLRIPPGWGDAVVDSRPGPFIIGAGLSGNVDEVRVWNRALPAREVQERWKMNLLGTEPGLITYFNFDFQQGATADDRSVLKNPTVEYGLYVGDAHLAGDPLNGPPIYLDPIRVLARVALVGLYSADDGGSSLEDHVYRMGVTPFNQIAYAGVLGGAVRFKTLSSDMVPYVADSDGDGLPDWWESVNGLSPDDYSGDNGKWGDPDRDGLSNLAEYLGSLDGVALDPLNPDSMMIGLPDFFGHEPGDFRIFGEKYTDFDGIGDWWEELTGLDPTLYDAAKDIDQDGWGNRSEFMGSLIAGTGQFAEPGQPGVANPALNTSWPRPNVTFVIKYKGVENTGSLLVTAYHSAAMDGPPDATLLIPTGTGPFPFTYTTNAMTTGHLWEGANWFFAWFDNDGNGAWSPGEPAGLSEQQAVHDPVNFVNMRCGNVGPIVLDICRSQPRHTAPDHSLPGYARFTWPGRIPEGSYFIYIRTTGGEAVFERTMKAPRNYFHEGDFMYAGYRAGMSSLQSYQWFVYTNIWQAPFASGSFQISYETTLSTPTPVTPEGAVFPYAQNELQWKAGSNTVEFAVQLSRNASFSPVLWGYTIVAPFRESDGSYRYTPPLYGGDALPDGVYYWRVQARTPKAASAWSATRSFRIDLADKPAGPYSISGEVSYFGKVTNGVIVVQAFKGSYFGGQPVAQVQLLNRASAANWPDNRTAFRLPGLRAGAYYVRAFLDQNANYWLDTWETWGFAESTAYVPDDLIVPPSATSVRVPMVFADTDQDHIVDDWEYMYGVTRNAASPLTVMGPGSVNGYTDYDGNGFNDYQSYAASPMNINPLDRNSKLADGIPLRIKSSFGLDLLTPFWFEVASIETDASGRTVVRWRPLQGGTVTPGANGTATQTRSGSTVSYQLQYSEDYVHWTTVPGVGALVYDAASGEFRFTNTLSSRKGAYRYRFTWQ